VKGTQVKDRPQYDQAAFDRTVALARAVGVDQAAEETGIERTRIIGWVWLAKRRATMAAKSSESKKPRASRKGRDQRHPVEELAQLYKDGMSTSQLAALTGRSQSGIYSLLRRHGVKMRTRKQAVRLRKGGTPTHGRIKREAIYHLADAGYSQTKIAATLSISNSTVQYHMRRRPPAIPDTPTQLPSPPAATAAESENSFGKNVRFLRGIHGLTGAALARFLGVTPQTISEWEHASHDPTWVSIQRTSRFFGVPVELLTSGTIIQLGRDYFASDRYTRTQHTIDTRSRTP
jgi:DNA-binding XRE family transcriptional regulator/DNA-binding CsgD family transcriptional regulator